jgi:cobalt/nickel transport system permease protein
MIAVHVLIGLGEAIISALTVSAVLSLRPDLVFGARGKLKSSLKLNTTGSQE